MEDQGILLEEASFKFSKDANCLSYEEASFKFSKDANCLSYEDEFLEIEAHSSLGIDRDNDCFFVLKTEKWSVDGIEDLEKLFERIRKVVIKK